MTTATPSAELGRSTAGFESFSTKSGTNDYHGTGFAIIKNAAFDANNWFNNGFKAANCSAGEADYLCSYSRPQDSKFDYGGTFGGPVRIPKVYDGHDRSFFFFGWEQYELHQGFAEQSTVPDDGRAKRRLLSQSRWADEPDQSVYRRCCIAEPDLRSGNHADRAYWSSLP